MTWWKEALFYQIYIRSFCDTNSDGVGDLPGITSRLSYLQNLGINALWLTPFYKSPLKDFGYDISDYRQIDLQFGTDSDFKELLKSAHSKSIKVIIDMAFSHSSDQCEYFKISRQSKTNPYSDWYVWADPKPDGSPPNNWQSIFGGPAWTYEPRRQQYYLHNFLKEQPDLNFHNLDVQNFVLDVMRHWLEVGIDGFRLDVCNFYFHNPQLTDNPPRPKEHRPTGGSILNSPYQYQLHVHDKDQPANLMFLEKMRKLTDQYPDKFLMAEIASDNQTQIVREYTGKNRLHSAYSFELLVEDFSFEHLAKVCNELKDSHPCWSFSNHDVKRVATRWAKGDLEKAKSFFALLLALKGTPIIYQGEECGYNESDLDYKDLVDPYGLAFYPEFKGRDGCRTPLPWTSSVSPMWLPYDPLQISKNILSQDQDPESFLNFAKKQIAFRQKHSELFAYGDIEFKTDSEGHSLTRKHKGRHFTLHFDRLMQKFSMQLD